MGDENIKKTLRRAWNYKWIYIMLLPVMAYFIVFRYVPMYGITIAFKDYNIFKGIIGSPWVGVKVFNKIFSNKNFWSSIRNTFLLNLSALAVSFPLTIVVALMLNEVAGARFKKITQSILYLPHFISWVVVA
ncbi:MAG: sugar ABC transporter permease, partial [Butyrivibrio sp.]|nr:sugar ABC transporter permease [Butyrivibrio sp.]